MFTAALFTIAKHGNNPVTYQEMAGLRSHTHTHRHTHTHTNITQNEIQPFAEMWMDLENIMLSEMSGR